ncbi:MAG: hypothetical protein HZB67_02005 [Candidatus Aenigmarchaeota archaeon]|nr:hypothetical protein [Candidatus Aenigmarchaeota archaeon]
MDKKIMTALLIAVVVVIAAAFLLQKPTAQTVAADEGSVVDDSITSLLDQSFDAPMDTDFTDMQNDIASDTSQFYYE